MTLELIFGIISPYLEKLESKIIKLEKGDDLVTWVKPTV
jgi:hypothetical protein